MYGLMPELIIDKRRRYMTKTDHFYDLSLSDQDNLIDHIIFYYKMIPSINYQQTARGLKVHFNSEMEHQITSQCFMEAMVKAGYRAVPSKKDTNWYFNVGRVQFISH